LKTTRVWKNITKRFRFHFVFMAELIRKSSEYFVTKLIARCFAWSSRAKRSHRVELNSSFLFFSLSLQVSLATQPTGRRGLQKQQTLIIYKEVRKPIKIQMLFINSTKNEQTCELI
jgi:hypothetical protein